MLTIFVMSAGAVLVAGTALLIAVIDGLYPPRREDPPAEPAPPPEPPARRVSSSASLPACGSFW